MKPNLIRCSLVLDGLSNGLGGWLGRWFGARWSVRCGRSGGKNPGQLDLVHHREIGLQVRVALVGDQVLARGFAVAGIDFFHHIHAFDDCAEGGKAHAVEAGVVNIVDEELGSAAVGAGGGEDKATPLVALNHGIILDFGIGPDLVDSGVGAEPELHHKALDDAEESRVGEVAVAHQVVKAVRAEGRPVAMDFNDEVARGGRELCLEDPGCLGRERCRVEQGWTRAGSGGVGGAGPDGGAVGGSALGSRGLGMDEEAGAQNNDRRNCFHDSNYTKRRTMEGIGRAGYRRALFPAPFSLPLPSNQLMLVKPRLGRTSSCDAETIQRVAASVGDLSRRAVVEIADGIDRLPASTAMKWLFDS